MIKICKDQIDAIRYLIYQQFLNLERVSLFGNEASSFHLFFIDPGCNFIADKMLISLGSGVSLQFGDNLTFVTGNGIIELQSVPAYANEVKGSITLIKPEDVSQYEPDFTLSAPTEICSTGSFDIQTGDLQGFGRGSADIEWDIQTDPPGTSGANIPRLKAILLGSFKGSQIFQIPASLVTTIIFCIYKQNLLIYSCPPTSHIL